MVGVSVCVAVSVEVNVKVRVAVDVSVAVLLGISVAVPVGVGLGARAARATSQADRKRDNDNMMSKSGNFRVISQFYQKPHRAFINLGVRSPELCPGFKTVIIRADACRALISIFCGQDA